MPPASPRSPSHPTGGEGDAPTHRLSWLRNHSEPMKRPSSVLRPERAKRVERVGRANGPRGARRCLLTGCPPASPRSPSHPTGGKGTVDRMPPASPRSPSHPTGGKGTPPPSRSVSRGTRLVRHDSGLIRHLVAHQPSSDVSWRSLPPLAALLLLDWAPLCLRRSAWPATRSPRQIPCRLTVDGSLAVVIGSPAGPVGPAEEEGYPMSARGADSRRATAFPCG